MTKERAEWMRIVEKAKTHKVLLLPIEECYYHFLRNAISTTETMQNGTSIFKHTVTTIVRITLYLITV